MPISKQDTAVAAILGLLALTGKKASASTGPRKPGAGWKPRDPEKDAQALHKRANQKEAGAWAVTFADIPGHPLSPLTAAALARWAGIESSGKATTRSRLDERGLMQAGPASVTDGELTPDEFAQLINPQTTRAQHAALAVKYVDALANKAMTYVANPPKDPVDLLWYAKLWHQRPVDVRDAGIVGPDAEGKQVLTATGHPAGMTGDALSDSHALAVKYVGTLQHALASGDLAGAQAADNALHRLHAANMVAWGTATP